MKTNDELLESLIHEYSEVLSKIVRLRVFLDHLEDEQIVGAEHLSLLNIQQKAMETYAETLFQRIRLVERKIKK